MINLREKNERFHVVKCKTLKCKKLSVLNFDANFNLLLKVFRTIKKQDFPKILAMFGTFNLLAIFGNSEEKTDFEKLLAYTRNCKGMDIRFLF